MPGRSGRIGGRLLLILAVAAATLLPGPVAAAGAGGASWTPGRAHTTLVVSGFRTMRSSVYAMVALRWSRATYDGLRAYTAEGLAFTLEVNDLAGRLSATGAWISDLPGATYDRDDDDGDGRWEEVEVTAADSAAIEPRRTYHVGLQLSRWYRPCGVQGCRWRWEHRAGRLATLGQLSAWFLGEWQAQRWTAPWVVQPVPRMAKPPSGPSVAAGHGSAGARTIVLVGRWQGRQATCGVPDTVRDPVRTCRRLGLREIGAGSALRDAAPPAIRPTVITEDTGERPWAAPIR